MFDLNFPQVHQNGALFAWSALITFEGLKSCWVNNVFCLYSAATSAVYTRWTEPKQEAPLTQLTLGFASLVLMQFSA